MRSAPAALKTWLAAGNNVVHRADLFTVVLADGTTTYRWTTWDRHLIVSGQTFIAGINGLAPLVKRSLLSSSSRLTVDTLDLTLNGQDFTIGGKSLGQLGVAGYFDRATVQLDHLIMPTPGDASLGAIPAMFLGNVASVQPVGPDLVLRLKSALEALNEMVPRFLISPKCQNFVYDANCGLSKAAFTLAGTVNGSPTTSSISTGTAGITAKAAGYYNLGVIKFTSGALAGTARAIKAWSSPTFTLQIPLPAAPSAGDAFTVYPVCNGSKSDCSTKFVNLGQYRGYPHVPASTGGSR